MALTKGGMVSIRKVTYDMRPLATGVTVFKGGRVAMSATGFLKRATGVNGEIIVNAIFNEDKVNAGADGAVLVEVMHLTERTLLLQRNDAGTAVVVADRETPCYQLDDDTVTGADTEGYAGIVYDVTTEGVWVDVGAGPRGPAGP